MTWREKSNGRSETYGKETRSVFRPSLETVFGTGAILGGSGVVEPAIRGRRPTRLSVCLNLCFHSSLSGLREGSVGRRGNRVGSSVGKRFGLAPRAAVLDGV